MESEFLAAAVYAKDRWFSNICCVSRYLIFRDTTGPYKVLRGTDYFNVTLHPSSLLRITSESSRRTFKTPMAQEYCALKPFDCRVISELPLTVFLAK